MALTFCTTGKKTTPVIQCSAYPQSLLPSSPLLLLLPSYLSHLPFPSLLFSLTLPLLPRPPLYILTSLAPHIHNRLPFHSAPLVTTKPRLLYTAAAGPDRRGNPGLSVHSSYHSHQYCNPIILNHYLMI